MLEDQLIVGAGFQNQGKFVKALYPAQKLRAVNQINCYGRFLATREIEKTILDVLW